MNFFEAFKIARQLVSFGKFAAETGVAIAELFHKNESSEKAEALYRERKSQEAGSKAAYNAAKNVGKK